MFPIVGFVKKDTFSKKAMIDRSDRCQISSFGNQLHQASSSPAGRGFSEVSRGRTIEDSTGDSEHSLGSLRQCDVNDPTIVATKQI